MLDIPKDCEHGIDHLCDGHGRSWGIPCRQHVQHCLCDRHLDEKLEEAVEEATENRYLIWSFEHDAWWRPASIGYTKNRTEAGEYSFKEAMKIVLGANIHFSSQDPDKMPNEAMVPLSTS